MVSRTRGDADVTRSPARDYDPAWSPDGRSLAFVSNRGGKPTSRDVYVVNADGSGLRNLTPGSRLVDRSPAWSPDGRSLAFVSSRYPSGIYVMNADGMRQRRLTGGHSWVWAVAWSPDGRTLAFADDHCGVCVVSADGRLRRAVPYSNPTIVTGLVRSPDGRKIAIARDRDARAQITVLDADGSGRHELTHNDAYDGDPAWSPDGRRIAFVSHRDGDYGLYVMNADGGDQQRLGTRRQL